MDELITGEITGEGVVSTVCGYGRMPAYAWLVRDYCVLSLARHLLVLPDLCPSPPKFATFAAPCLAHYPLAGGALR
jgi:hypothetical protein